MHPALLLSGTFSPSRIRVSGLLASTHLLSTITSHVISKDHRSGGFSSIASEPECFPLQPVEVSQRPNGEGAGIAGKFLLNIDATGRTVFFGPFPRRIKGGFLNQIGLCLRAEGGRRPNNVSRHSLFLSVCNCQRARLGETSPRHLNGARVV